jgi:hypothetical protein
MDNKEAEEFINLKLRQLYLSSNDRTQLEPLLRLTGGNPKAIEIILGLMKHKRLSLSKTIEDLKSVGGELFDTLFARCWGLIDTDTRQALLAMEMFPYSASAEALFAVSDIKQLEFDIAIERLTDLSLIDVLQKDLESLPRYNLYSLVSAFVSLKNKEDKKRLALYRKRWVEWYSAFAARIGFCWNDISKLKLLDPPGERQTVQLVISWAYQNEMYDKAVQISKDVRYYFYGNCIL